MVAYEEHMSRLSVRCSLVHLHELTSTIYSRIFWSLSECPYSLNPIPLDKMKNHLLSLVGGTTWIDGVMETLV